MNIIAGGYTPELAALTRFVDNLDTREQLEMFNHLKDIMVTKGLFNGTFA